MKVKIGPYITWIGPYQIADLLQKFGVSKDKCYEIGTWLCDHTFLYEICLWIHSFKNRNIKIRIERHDTWSMDHTLAMIIHPMLVQLKETNHGAPTVDLEDVPEELRGKTSEDPDAHDDMIFKRWDWIMDEMIWTFGQLADAEADDMFYDAGTRNVNIPAYQAYHNRIKRGTMLFGKYYRGLWD